MTVATNPPTPLPPESPCPCCGTVLTGAFCRGCGQRADTRRLVLRDLVARFLGVVTSFEGPLPRTALGLLCRPGVVVGEYLRGRRIVYTNPVQWAVLTSGAAALVSHLLGRSGPVQIRLNGNEPDWLRRLLDQLGSNSGPLFVLVLLPALAVALRLCLRRLQLSFAEHFVLVLYAYGLGALLQVVWALLAVVGAPHGPEGLLPVVWTTWAVVGLAEDRRFATALLALVAHVVWVLLLVAAALAVFGVCWLLGLVGG